jgi:hypothetical protein
LSEFIFKNRSNLISQRNINVLRQTAKAPEAPGKQNPVLLLHHGELLSKCQGLTPKHLKEFLNRLCEDGSKTRKKFIEDVKKAQSANKDEAAAANKAPTGFELSDNKPGPIMVATPGSQGVVPSHQQVAAESSLNYGRQEDLTEELSGLDLENEGSQLRCQPTHGNDDILGMLRISAPLLT